MRHLTVLFALTLALSACDSESVGESGAAAGDLSTSATSASEVVKQEALPITGIQLAARGILFLHGRDNPKTLVPFGVSRARIEQALDDAGYHDPQEGSNDECPGGPLEFLEYGSFGLSIENGAFAGWALGEGEAASLYQTDTGVSLGMTKADVARLSNPVPFPDSTLGDEFYIGPSEEAPGIAGIFDTDGRVEALWAGVVCNFR